MTHRKSVVFLPCTQKAKIKECMLKDSIYPVYGKDYDDIGVVDLKSFSY
jgi:hypothetical protein